MKICKRCLLVSNKHIKILEDGVCEICHNYKPDLLLSLEWEKKVIEIKKNPLENITVF